MQNPNVPRNVAFGEKPEVIATKGLKIKNKPKELTPEQKKQQMASRLEEVAEQAVKNIQERNKQAAEIIKQYVDCIKSKHLESNRGEVGKRAESKVIDNLVNIAILLNNDEREENEGMGSVSLLNLLLKIGLFQRNRINELEYKIAELDHKFNELEHKFNKAEYKVKQLEK